jgi:hypothetical protein
MAAQQFAKCLAHKMTLRQVTPKRSGGLIGIRRNPAKLIRQYSNK